MVLGGREEDKPDVGQLDVRVGSIVVQQHKNLAVLTDHMVVEPVEPLVEHLCEHPCLVVGTVADW